MTLPPYPSPTVELNSQVLDAVKGKVNHATKTLSSRGDQSQASGSRGVGNVRKQQKETDNAIYCYRNAFDSNPMYIPALFNLAKELTGQNQHNEAKEHFQKILEIEPNHAGALAAIGQ